MDKLLNCPFCDTGITPEIEKEKLARDHFIYSVVCPNCLGIGPFDETEEKAIAAWNTRHTPWQPMETAPKDGTEILLAHDGVSTSGNYVNGRWAINPDKGRGGYPGWVEVYPTAWLPLPKAPEAKP